MKLPALLLALSITSTKAQDLPPAGGGGHNPGPSVCLTSVQQAQINQMLATSIQSLQQRGVLPAASNRAAAATPVKLGWPLKQAAGFSYNSIYGISNFVDHNKAYPNKVQDWNCGSRTYDLSDGYNHAGVDIFLWPFSINMMENRQAEIVAAAPGVIIAKTDGNYDLNCALTNANAPWNAVYVRNADGTVCWYGHMKKGSLTTKAVGASVAQGEFLGNVGSSGSSSGPHLHFELHDAAGKVLDPYHGNCSPNATAWAAQKPYYEPTINALLTHTAAPAIADCPNKSTINASSVFVPGDRIYFAGYFHDQQANQPTTYTIYRPDNSVFATWTHSSTDYFNSSYWYWPYVLPTSAPTGAWRFRATFQGVTVTHGFTVRARSTAFARAASSAFSVYPNPAHQNATVELADAQSGGEAVIQNQLGQTVSRQAVTSRKLVLALPSKPGLYLVTLPTATGPVTQKLVVE